MELKKVYSLFENLNKKIAVGFAGVLYPKCFLPQDKCAALLYYECIKKNYKVDFQMLQKMLYVNEDNQVDECYLISYIVTGGTQC